MKIIRRFISCILAGSAFACLSVSAEPRVQSAAAAADPTSSVVTLASAVEAAWRRAVQSSEASGQLTRARAEQAAATAWWSAPPSLEFSHGSGRWQGDGGGRETEIGVAVPVWLPGQRLARGQAVQAEFDAAEVGATAARLRVAGQVRETAWSIAALNAEVESTESRYQSLQSLAADVDRRVSAGALARTDSLAARAEVLAVESTQAEALARLESANASWMALTGFSLWVNPVEQVAQSDMDAGVDDHPELRLTMRQVALAQRRLDLAGRSKRSPPEVMAWYRHESPGSPASTSNIVGIGVRLPLGTDDRNQPLLAAASTELDAAQATATALRERLVADLAATRAILAAAEQQVGVERRRAALLRERTQLVAAAFRAGETSLPETLRTYAAAAQAQASLARQEAARGLAHARLQQALGIMP